MGRACVAALGVCIAGAAGCAANEAAAPAAAEPTGMKLESREPATIEEAQAQLEQARAQLPGAAAFVSTTPAAEAGGVPGPTGGGVTTQSTTETALPDTSSKRRELQRCGNACGAMQSMRHAVDAICRMAGESDARCTDARRTLKDSETKVAGCGCPAP